jgi:hypothetical protein
MPAEINLTAGTRLSGRIVSASTALLRVRLEPDSSERSRSLVLSWEERIRAAVRKREPVAC